jgi:hypothetical protein
MPGAATTCKVKSCNLKPETLVPIIATKALAGAAKRLVLSLIRTVGVALLFIQVTGSNPPSRIMLLASCKGKLKL